MSSQLPPPAPPTVDPACTQACPMCGSTVPPVFVHGHVQCATCTVNIDPCCGGAPPVSDAADDGRRG